MSNNRIWFGVETNLIPHCLVINSLHHVNFPPRPRGFCSPLACLHTTCFLSGLRVNYRLFWCICLCEVFSAVFWVVKEEGEAEPCPMETYSSRVYSASRDSSHWNSWESRPSMRCNTPQPERWDAAVYWWLLCASQVLKCNQTWSLCKRSNKASPFFLGISSNKHQLFCVNAPIFHILLESRAEQHESKTHESNLILVFRINLDLLSDVTSGDLWLYVVYCCCFAHGKHFIHLCWCVPVVFFGGQEDCMRD